jgi:DNA-binding LacI/PurR family transcriptional regulator
MDVIKSSSEAGLHIPDNISLDGFYDHLLARMCTPAASKVRQDFVVLGRPGFGLPLRAMEVCRSPPTRPS